MENKKLISLQDFNSMVVNTQLEPKPNGIECPKCKNELIDSSPGAILTSYPPQTHVECKHCGYKGTRFV